jgi:hypothetical protein
MRFTGLVALLLALAAPGAQPPKTAISRAILAPLESGFDGRMSTPGQADPYDLLGNTRGVYLEGYGVVFSTEVNLIVAPAITPFRPTISKEVVEAVHRRKMAKLDVLKKAMREMLTSSAAALDTLPPSSQVVLAVTLFYYSWEQRAGLPSQIVMRAPRSALLRGDALEASLRVEEF